MSTWKEIRCDHLDTIDNFWRVDAWLTPSDIEEGKVIAYIDNLTGRVIYLNPIARTDKYAQEVIRNKIKELNTVNIEDKNGDIEVSMPTIHGKLIASIEPEAFSGSGYDAIYISLKPEGSDYDYIDLAAVRSHKSSPIYPDNPLDILIWEDLNNEDYTTRKAFTKKELKELVDINNNQE